MTTPHLDDAAISAHLDGEATPEEAAHIDGCERCGARLVELRAAAAAIGSPVPMPAPGRRDTAVAAALAAAPDAAGAKVASLADRRRRGLPQWLAVAAALLVVVALVPIVSSLRGDDGDEVATSVEGEGAGDEMATLESDAGAGGGGSGEPVAPIDAGDVGDVGPQDVRRLVEEAVLAPPAPATERSSADEGEEGTTASGQADDTAGTAAAAPAPAPCEDVARQEFPDLAALRYRALGTVEGEESSILAFDLAAPEPRVRVLVYDVAECGITLVQELEPS